MPHRVIQIRHMTDAQRLAMIPALGEGIWTTDTDLLYVGDGSTSGGVAVARHRDLLAVTTNALQTIESSAGWTKIPFGNEVKKDSDSFSYNVDGTVTFNFTGWVKVTYTVTAENPI